MKKFLLPLFLLFFTAVFAEDSAPETDDDATLIIDVEVRERVHEDAVVGKTEIPRDVLENMPKGDGTVSDLIRVAPGVQYDNNYRNSNTAGEISPAEVSISGGKPYENLFLIDGMSNSNMVNPLGVNKSLTNFSEVSGNPQKFFLDSWLVEDITVYDSNIPASFGGFTGGVVDVTTKKPEKEFGGKLSYRTTRSGWTHYYIDEKDKNFFKESKTYTDHPNFRKDFYTISLNIPINDDIGILARYNRKDSVIPLRHFNGHKDTERLSETYFLKGLYNIDGSRYIDASVSYSPYTGSYILQDRLHGDFDINSGGYFAALNYYDGNKDDGEIKLHTDYSFQENSRTGSRDYHYSWIASRFKPWGAATDSRENLKVSSLEGGPGNLKMENGNLSLKFDHNLKPMSLSGVHRVSYGAVYNNIYGRYYRPEDYSYYKDAVLSRDVRCGDDTKTCVDGDQYFSSRYTLPVSDVLVWINEYEGYGEDEWEFLRFNLRLGVRVSNDDYQNNTNFSPRTQFQYDIFNDNRTVLTLGYSRYYSANLLGSKLREGRVSSDRYFRDTYNNRVQNWMLTQENPLIEYNFRELRTPYVDEYSVNIAQNIYGSTLSAKYVERRAEDEFAKDFSEIEKDGKKHYRLNNNGSSSYRSAQLRWTKAWENHRVIFNGTWSESTASNENYDTLFGLEDMDTEVFLNGEIIKLKELPKDNFNKPYVFNLTYVGKYFNHLTVSGVFTYTTAHRRLISLNDEFMGYGDYNAETGMADEINFSSYKVAQFKDMCMLDASFSWEQETFKGQKFVLTVEVLNILDLKNKIGEGSRVSNRFGDYNYDKYQMGRQFWAGVAYEF
jgi:hypothetical protein